MLQWHSVTSVGADATEICTAPQWQLPFIKPFIVHPAIKRRFDEDMEQTTPAANADPLAVSVRR
jgi:hypothetical protein